MAAYVLTVCQVARRTVLLFNRRLEDELTKLQQYDDNLVQKCSEARMLQDHLTLQAQQIFTLYHLTKEITRNFNEEDAFEVFKKHLAQKVSYDECLLIHPLSQEIVDLQFDPAFTFFPLQGKNKLLGFFALKGLSPQHQETVAILANQFSLALRRIRLYQEIERLAITDSLTEVYTRRYLWERLEEEIVRSKTRKIHLAVLMLDVDHFKSINDQYGHLTGDQVLREIARIIRDNVREIDIVGRFGGEEFCVVLPDTDAQGAGYVAQRIRSGVEKANLHIYDALVKVTISIGLATMKQGECTAAELIDQADTALYRAKSLGRNQICVAENDGGG